MAIRSLRRHGSPRVQACLAPICLLCLATSAARTQQTATVGGSLVDRITRQAVEGARISILGTTLGTRSDTSGVFHVDGVPAGVRVIQVRAIGYAVASWMVELREGQMLRQIFELEGRTLAVDSIVVTASAGGDGWRSESGFEQRRRSGVGHFITRADIQQRRAANIGDLMRTVPGLITTCRGRGCTVLMPGTRLCAPEFFLDGYRATFATGPSFPVQQIRGVEVYRNRSDVPAEFQLPNLSCGVIAIWTIEPGTPLERN